MAAIRQYFNPQNGPYTQAMYQQLMINNQLHQPMNTFQPPLTNNNDNAKMIKTQFQGNNGAVGGSGNQGNADQFRGNNNQYLNNSNQHQDNINMHQNPQAGYQNQPRQFGKRKWKKFNKCPTCKASNSFCRHCFFCGALDHEISQCPRKNEE